MSELKVTSGQEVHFIREHGEKDKHEYCTMKPFTYHLKSGKRVTVAPIGAICWDDINDDDAKELLNAITRDYTSVIHYVRQEIEDRKL